MVYYRLQSNIEVLIIIITLSSAVSWLATLPGVSEPAIDLSITFLSWSSISRSDDDNDGDDCDADISDDDIDNDGENNGDDGGL